MLTIEIPGRPKAKGRPRFVRATGRTYTDDKTVAYEQLVALATIQARGQADPLAGPCRVELTAVFERPGRLNRKRDPDGRMAMDCRAAGTDVDNIAKSVLDGLVKGGAMADDKQVVELVARKVYGAKGEAPHTIVRVEAA